MITTRQGPLLQGEWRHRLLNGAYSIRATGIFQQDKDLFVNTPGYLDWRGSLETSGSSIFPTGGYGAGTRPFYRTRTISTITVSCETCRRTI